MELTITFSKVSANIGFISVMIMILTVSAYSLIGWNLDLSPLIGISTYTGVSFNENPFFCTGVNGFFIFLNGGLEYNANTTEHYLEGFVGISPLPPTIIQTQIGYGSDEVILKVRTDLNVSSLLKKRDHFMIPLWNERKGLRRLMFSAGYEYYMDTHEKNNYQVTLGLLF